MIILIEGEKGTGKTFFCRELNSATAGKMRFFDACDCAQVVQIAQTINRIPENVIVLTGDTETIDYAELVLRRVASVMPISRLEVKEPTING